MLKKYLTPDLVNSLMSAKTKSYQSSLFDVVKSGIVNPDSSVGVFAPDIEAYTVFKDLLLPIIKDYHKLPEGFTGQPPQTWGRVSQIGKFGTEVLSTRIRIARSLKGRSFIDLKS